MGKLKNMFSTKAFRAGGYSVIASVIVIAMVCIVIGVTDSLPSKFTKLDTTKSNLFSLSDETKTFVSALENDVDIYLITRNGAEDALLKNILERYESLSGKVKVSIKDPVINPSFTDKYTAEEVTLNSLVVECGDKNVYIPYNDMFEQTFNADYTTATNFIGEAKITGAIRNVTEKSSVKLYTTEGHGETALVDATKEQIQNANIKTEGLNLITVDAVPADASCVLMYQPKRDITADELSLLGSYIDGGGSFMLYTGYAENILPNLNELMKKYGVESAEGIILEGDTKYCMNGQPYYTLPEISSHAITDPIINANYYVIAPLAHAIKQTPDAATDITTLLSTSKNSFRKINIETDLSEEDEAGSFDLGVAIEAGDGKVVWFSGTSMLEAQVGANSDLFLNSVNWLSGKDNGFTIRAKSLASESLTVPTSSARLWNVIFIFVIPVAFISFGVWVFLKRRKK